MGSSNTGIPVWAKRLLSVGEHPLVEYKGINVPEDLARVVASGANTAALVGSGEPFSVLFGVDEEKHGDSRRSGRLVGIRDAKDPTKVVVDLRVLENQVVNIVKTQVTPVPRLDFDYVNTGGRHPFVRLRVIPTTPPYRTEDRYGKRNGSHYVPLETGELLELLKPQVMGALEALSEGTPLASKLEAIALEVEILRRSLSEDDWDRERLESKVDELRSAMDASSLDEDMEELATALTAVEDSIRGDLGVAENESVWEMLVHIFRRLSVTSREEAFTEVIRHRRSAWMGFSLQEVWGDLSPDRLALGKALFDAFFLRSPNLDDYVRNLSEWAGWEVASGSTARRKDEALRILFGACFGATGRRVDAQWDSYGAQSDASHERDDLLSVMLRTARDGGARGLALFDSDSRGPEAVIIMTDAEVVRSLAESSGCCYTAPQSDIVGLRVRGHDIRVAFPRNGGPIAVTSLPGVISEERPDGVAEMRRWRKRLRRDSGLEVLRCSDIEGGLLGILAGERRRTVSPRSGSAPRRT